MIFGAAHVDSFAFFSLHKTTPKPQQLFNPVEIKPEMVGMYSGEFSMSYRYVRFLRPAVCCARVPFL